jgi:hypothetical protein
VASDPAWQQWLRAHQPPLLVLWGRYDPSFQTAEAQAYRRDVLDPAAAGLGFETLVRVALEHRDAGSSSPPRSC